MTWTLSRDALPFLDLLEAHADTFRREGRALSDQDFVPMPDASTYAGGAWQACPLVLEQWAHDFPAAMLDRNRARCPETLRLLQGIDGLVIGGFLRLAPGAEIALHQDIRDDDVIRAHLGLDLPDHERAYWPEGTARLMDIRQPHRASNPSDRWRLTLMVDVRLPFVVPDGAIGPWGPTE